MLHHLCDMAYDENMWGLIRTRKCRSTNWLINYMLYSYICYIWLERIKIYTFGAKTVISINDISKWTKQNFRVILIFTRNLLLYTTLHTLLLVNSEKTMFYLKLRCYYVYPKPLPVDIHLHLYRYSQSLRIWTKL